MAGEETVRTTVSGCFRTRFSLPMWRVVANHLALSSGQSSVYFSSGNGSLGHVHFIGSSDSLLFYSFFVLFQ